MGGILIPHLQVCVTDVAMNLRVKYLGRHDCHSCRAGVEDDIVIDGGVSLEATSQ